MSQPPLYVTTTPPCHNHPSRCSSVKAILILIFSYYLIFLFSYFLFSYFLVFILTGRRFRDPRPTDFRHGPGAREEETGGSVGSARERIFLRLSEGGRRFRKRGNILHILLSCPHHLKHGIINFMLNLKKLKFLIFNSFNFRLFFFISRRTRRKKRCC